MSHFAKVVDNIVVNVIVAESDFINSLVETTPGAFWLQTSYNTRGGIHYKPNSDSASEDQSKALRMNYAEIGGGYDPIRDAFIPVPLYPGWLLDSDTLTWYPPIPLPADAYSNGGDVNYIWNDSAENWETIVLD